MIGLFDRLARPFLHRLDPEDAHRIALRALQWAPLPPRAARRSAAAGARVRAEFPQSGRPRGRLRQEWRGAGRAAAARLRLRRDRQRHAAAAGRQSAPAPVPPRRRRRGDQPARLQQRWRGGRADAACRARATTAGSSASISAPTGQPGPRRGLCPADRGLRAGGVLHHRQRLLAEHAGPARPAARRRASTICWRA